MSDKGLIHLGEINRALAEATTIMEVKSLCDKAEALRTVCKKAKATIETVNRAGELKLRCERKAGEMLAAAKLNGGDRKSHLHGERVKLSDIGIREIQSHRWQRVATVPPAAFESYLADCRESEKEISTAAVLKLANHHKPKNGAEPVEQYVEGFHKDIAELDGRKFGCIYADPPWRYGNQGTRASTNNHYGTMTVEDICKLPFVKREAYDGRLVNKE